MIWIYRFLLLPALLVFGPYYLYRMLRRGGYGKDWPCRLGFLPRVPRTGSNKRIWVHAVSVGEVQAAMGLIDALVERGHEVVLTVTTSTGYAVAREKLGDVTLWIRPFPFELWPCRVLSWGRVGADLHLLMESELWPEQLFQAKKRGVPVVLANARMSDRTYRRYSQQNWLTKNTYGQLSKVLVSNVNDYNRLVELFNSPESIYFAGNLKLDSKESEELAPHSHKQLLAEIGFGSTDAGSPLILLGSSTWPGEEAFLLRIVNRFLNEGVPARLLLVPRHAERRNEIIPLLERSGFHYHVRSHGVAADSVDVCLADTTGELATLTHLADLVFIGKSLPPHTQGQSPVDAAAAGKAIVMGPGMTNFRDIVDGLVRSGGAVQVQSAVSSDAKKAAERILLQLAKNPEGRRERGENARAWLASNRGALDRTLQALEPYLQ